LLVNYYGADVPLQQLAGFSVPEPRQLVVKPHDRNAMAAIERAIRDSDLGVAPSNDGVVIRLNLPPLTEERRKEYVKITKHMAEDGRVAVRNVRRDGRKHLEAAEKSGEISADELDRAEKELEKITHEHVEEIDRALARKEHELLER
jgi:ribosome recycling factor